MVVRRSPRPAFGSDVGLCVAWLGGLVLCVGVLDRWLGVRWFGVGLGGEDRGVRSFRLCKLFFVFRIFVFLVSIVKFFYFLKLFRLQFIVFSFLFYPKTKTKN